MPKTFCKAAKAVESEFFYIKYRGKIGLGEDCCFKPTVLGVKWGDAERIQLSAEDGNQMNRLPGE
jgi:hypothetical protein